MWKNCEWLHDTSVVYKNTVNQTFILGVLFFPQPFPMSKKKQDKGNQVIPETAKMIPTIFFQWVLQRDLGRTCSLMQTEKGR